jgi:hypothetical protein
MEKNKEKKERRHSAPLPVSTAATIQVARSAANAVISNILQQLANPQREASEMDTSGNGTAEPKVIASGSGTASSSAGESGNRNLALHSFQQERLLPLGIFMEKMKLWLGPVTGLCLPAPGTKTSKLSVSSVGSTLPSGPDPLQAVLNAVAFLGRGITGPAGRFWLRTPRSWW